MQLSRDGYQDYKIQPAIGYHSTAAFNTKSLNDYSPRLLSATNSYSQLRSSIITEGRGLNTIPHFLQALAGLTLDPMDSFASVTQDLVHCLLESLHTIKVFSER